MEIMSLTEAKAKLSEVVDSVVRTHQRVTLTRNGRSTVVVIAAEDLEGLEATLDLLSDPATMARVDQAQREIDAGEPGASVEEVRAALQARLRASA